MKKEVYFFDKMFFNENLSLYQAMLKPLNELSRHYQSLELKTPFTKEIMLQAVNNAPELKNSIVQDLAELMNLGTVPKVVHESLKKQIEDSLKPVLSIAEKVRNEYYLAKQFTRTALIQDYTLFNVSESFEVTFDEQKLRDLCSIYLTNEKQKQAVDIVTQINKKIQELKSILNTQTVVPDSHREFLMNYTESFNGTDLNLNPWIIERLN
ncbi:MAG: hypothetical protein FD181_2676 [Prolixibacteraceae bacterium]|nr:MAG: hypothetical protein FD181_2676 [Prolixibacteraceae bacterium]